MCCITFNWAEGDFERKFKGPESGIRNPVWAIIDVTDVCNFNCEWCCAREDMKGRHMEKNGLKKLIDALASSGIMQVTFSGGEPTLYPHILWAIKHAKSKGMVVHMNTNGYVLNRGLLIRLKRAGLTQIQMNIDSIMPRKHDRVRGMEGSFERTSNAIIEAEDLGIMTVIQTVLTKDNQEEVFKIMDFARLLGAKRIRVWDMMISGSAKNVHEKVPKDYIEILKSLTAHAKEEGAISIKCAEPLFPLGHDTGMDVFDINCVCANGIAMNISSRGDVYYCCSERDVLYNIFDVIGEKGDIGTVHRESIRKYLEGRGLHEDCRKCEHLETCKGGCMPRIGFGPDGKDYMCSRSPEGGS